MCMLVVARRVHPRYPLIVVANRDEVLDRPTEPLHEWAPGPADTLQEHDGGRLLAGRDVTGGGTWLALAGGARLAAVTNVREPGNVRQAGAVGAGRVGAGRVGAGAVGAALRSRGELPVDALTGPVPAACFAGHIVDDLHEYGAVNLLAGDLDELWWASNRSTRGPLRLGAGVHGLSNAALDTPWPKVVGAVRELRALMGTDTVTGPEWSTPLLDLLADRRKAPLRQLPRTGVPLWQEWQLSSRFVRVGAWYGTRSTTAIRIDEHGTADVVERTWDARGRAAGTAIARV